jgi:hypothetical protein
MATQLHPALERTTITLIAATIGIGLVALAELRRRRRPPPGP